MVNSLQYSKDDAFRKIRWNIFISNITHALETAPQILPEVAHQLQLVREIINWGDPFFSYLITFHISLFCIAAAVWATCKQHEEVVLGFSLLLLFLSSLIFFFLDWLHEHANLFFQDDDNYFDEAGVFVVFMFWLPILLCAATLQCLICIRVNKSYQRRKIVAKNESSKGVGISSPDVERRGSFNAYGKKSE